MANSLRMKELGDIWKPQKIFGVLQNAAANRSGDLFSLEDSMQLLVY